MNVGLGSDRSDDFLVYFLLYLLLGDCLPDRRQVQMAWTVGESCSGVDDNLSAAAKAFVSSELVVDLAVLWQRVPPRGRNCTLANKALHASFRRINGFISLENHVRNSPVVNLFSHHKVKSTAG